MALRTEWTEDTGLQRLQEELKGQLDPVLEDRWLSRQKITVSLTSGVANLVYHNLKAQPEGWLVVQKDANANIWADTFNSERLDLRCSADVIITLYVW